LRRKGSLRTATRGEGGAEHPKGWRAGGYESGVGKVRKSSYDGISMTGTRSTRRSSSCRRSGGRGSRPRGLRHPWRRRRLLDTSRTATHLRTRRGNRAPPAGDWLLESRARASLPPPLANLTKPIAAAGRGTAEIHNQRAFGGSRSSFKPPASSLQPPASSLHSLSLSLSLTHTHTLPLPYLVVARGRSMGGK
jgi:hypothetical protein